MQILRICCRWKDSLLYEMLNPMNVVTIDRRWVVLTNFPTKIFLLSKYKMPRKPYLLVWNVLLIIIVEIINTMWYYMKKIEWLELCWPGRKISGLSIFDMIILYFMIFHSNTDQLAILVIRVSRIDVRSTRSRSKGSPQLGYVRFW